MSRYEQPCTLTPLDRANLAVIVRAAQTIEAATDRLDELAERLRDLADPRLVFPDLAALRERLRDWAADLDAASAGVYHEAVAIGGLATDALDDEEVAS